MIVHVHPIPFGRVNAAKGRNQTLTTEAQRTQSQELILSAAEAADSILHAASRHGEYLFFSVASVPLWFNQVFSDQRNNNLQENLVNKTRNSGLVAQRARS
jgi:hypothetical protein